jgi:hypothetical protein
MSAAGSTLGVSLSTNPVQLGVIVGAGAPITIVALDAVICSGGVEASGEL